MGREGGSGGDAKLVNTSSRLEDLQDGRHPQPVLRVCRESERGRVLRRLERISNRQIWKSWILARIFRQEKLLFAEPGGI